MRWFIPRKFGKDANAQLVDSTEEENFQFIFNMSSVMSGKCSTTGRLHKFVCSSFGDVGKFKKKFWKIQNFDTQLSVGNYDILTNKLT